MFHTFGTKTLAAAGQVINDGGARSVNVLIAKNNMQSVGGLKTDEKRPADICNLHFNLPPRRIKTEWSSSFC